MRAYEYPDEPDTTAPAIIGVTSIRPYEIDVLFNERMDIASAQNIEDYSVDRDVVIAEAQLSENQKLVVLFVSQLSENTSYSLTVGNVMDIGGNPITPDTTIRFEHHCGSVTASTYGTLPELSRVRP